MKNGAAQAVAGAHFFGLGCGVGAVCRRRARRARSVFGDKSACIFRVSGVTIVLQLEPIATVKEDLP